MKLFEALANTPERRERRNAIRTLCGKFNDGYWAEKDRLHEFPYEFADAVAARGWLGITMPVEFGGAGIGVTGGAIMMPEIGHGESSLRRSITSKDTSGRWLPHNRPPYLAK